MKPSNWTSTLFAPVPPYVDLFPSLRSYGHSALTCLINSFFFSACKTAAGAKLFPGG